MDIENSNFDAKRYVLNMLKQNSLKELIRRNNQIDEEIKVHDHEIQSLVFENYSKFISSIDTVRQMKDNICKVDDKLQVLESSMDQISDLATKIDGTFSVKRKEIQKLDTINKDLQKLKNLCEFPNVLKQDIAYYKSLSEGKLSSEVDSLFNKSIASYESSYKTLINLKNEPLIAPIHKESIDKIETMRSILKALQVQFNKNKNHSSILRNITKKLLIISDDQVSILRIYLHSWKQRFGEACFKSEKKKITDTFVINEDAKKELNEVKNSEIPEINQQLWKQFEMEFSFIYNQVYPKLTISAEEIQLHISNYIKEIFTWALNHYTEAVPNYCSSLKSYVQVNYFISEILRNSLSKMEVVLRQKSKEQLKVYQDLKSKMQQKFESLGVTMLNFIFGRLKLYFIEEVIDAKNNCKLIPVSEEILKESYIKILNPLKQNLTTNFKYLLDDMEHFKNTYEVIFKSQNKYQQLIHKQIQNLLKFLTVVISRAGTIISEELCIYVNQNYNQKINKAEKGLIQKIVKKLIEVPETGCWFVVANSFLNSLHNNIGKKIIDNTQKNVEIPKNHNYVHAFTFIKQNMSKNLICLANHYSSEIKNKSKFEDMIIKVQDFIDILNIAFVDSKRNMIKKPSFLYETNLNIHETQILTVKKLPLIEKKNPCQRNLILTYFIRKVLKQLLISIRQKKFSLKRQKLGIIDVYCLLQICYELSNVEEENQIIAYYNLILQNSDIEWTISKEEADEKYTEVRKLLKTQTNK